MGVIDRSEWDRVAQIAATKMVPSTIRLLLDPLRERHEAEVERLTEQLAGAVSLTDAERERMLWWLRQPVPPGPMKVLDEAIIRKLEGW